MKDHTLINYQIIKWLLGHFPSKTWIFFWTVQLWRRTTLQHPTQTQQPPHLTPQQRPDWTMYPSKVTWSSFCSEERQVKIKQNIPLNLRAGAVYENASSKFKLTFCPAGGSSEIGNIRIQGTLTSTLSPRQHPFQEELAGWAGDRPRIILIK